MPTRREWACIALALLCLLVAASLARGAVDEPVGGETQRLADATAAYLTVTLGEPVGPRRIEVITPEDVTSEPRLGDAAGVYQGWYVLGPDDFIERVGLKPEVVEYLAIELARLRERGGRLEPGGNGNDLSDYETLLHEMVHKEQDLATTGHDRNIAEGTTEALTADLLAPASRAILGARRAVAGVGYPVFVRAVREASRLATNSRSWRDRAARLWRRDLWRADTIGRRVMMATATALRRSK